VCTGLKYLGNSFFLRKDFLDSIVRVRPVFLIPFFSAVTPFIATREMPCYESVTFCDFHRSPLMSAAAPQLSHIRKDTSQYSRYIPIESIYRILIRLVVSVVRPSAENHHAQEYKVSHWCTRTGSCPLRDCSSAIYSLIDQNYNEIQTTTRACMTSMISAQTWEDRSPGIPASRRNTLSGVIVFKTLSTVLSQ
jgi:hypothetical protein